MVTGCCDRIVKRGLRQEWPTKNLDARFHPIGVISQLASHLANRVSCLIQGLSLSKVHSPKRSPSPTSAVTHLNGGQLIAQGCADHASFFHVEYAAMRFAAIAMALTTPSRSGPLDPSA